MAQDPPPPELHPTAPPPPVPLEEAAAPPSGAQAAVETTTPPNESRWTRAYNSAHSRLPPSVSRRLPSAAEAQDAVSSLSERLSHSATESRESLQARRDKLRSGFLSHGYSVANATHIPLYISLNQVGPVLYDAVEPNGVFERRVPGLWFQLEVRAAGGPYTGWSVAWPILAVTGPIVAISSLAALPLAAAVTGSVTLAGLSTAVVSGVTAMSTSALAAGTKVASAAARLAMLPGGKKLHGKLVDAAKQHVDKFKKSGTEHVLRYVTTAMAALKTGKAAAGKGKTEEHVEAEEEEEAAPPPREKFAEIDVTGYPLEKVIACKTGKRKLDAELEKAFKKLDFKTRDFQPKTNPVLRVVGGAELEEREKGRQFLVFYPLCLEHIVDLQAEPLPTEEAPLTEQESRLAHADPKPSGPVQTPPAANAA